MADTLPPISALPLKHQRFIVEYLQDLNVTQAALRAGYSPKTAHVQGSQLLSRLRAYVEPMAGKHIQPKLMKAADVVDSLVRIASTDIRDFMKWDGNTLVIKSSDELTPEQAQCIESVSLHETQHVKYLKLKLHPKVKALDALAKHHNLFKQVQATKGLMVVYQRPQNQAIPTEAKVVEGEVIEGKWKPVAKKIEWKRPEAKANGNGNGNGANGHGSNGSAKNGLHTGPITHDQGTA